MSTILSIASIIEIGKVSIYKSANYVAKGALFGGTVIKPIPPVQIAWVTDALEWGYDGGAQTEQSLRQTGNYAYWLYGKFGLEAQYVIDGAGGGSVTPTPSGGLRPNQLNFTVAASGTPILDGETTVTLSDFIGWNLVLDKNGQPMTQISTAPIYYTWNRVTGLLILNQAAITGDEFQITPV